MAARSEDSRVAEFEGIHRRMTAGDLAARAEMQRRLPELLRLADGGDVDAQALAGGLFAEQFKRPAEARRYFEMAAKQGHVAGRRGLGFMLLRSGERLEVDRAVALLTSAAQDGDAFAAYNLGMLFRKGELVAADEARARASFQLAGTLGLGAGAAVFAEYLAADGLYEQAREWNLRGAEAGSVPAMYALAKSYCNGIGGPVDRVQAVRWFLRMLDRGDTRGVDEVVRIAALMSPEQIREAARLGGRAEDARVLIERAHTTDARRR